MMLNRTLDFFIENTESPKFIIITDSGKDITLKDALKFEIDEVSDIDAARLLLLCANQNIEEHNKNLDQLAKHEIFSLISRNPSSIVRFSQYLRSCSKTLDEIVKENKLQIQQLKCEINVREDDVEVQVGEECSWVIKESYEHLSKSYTDEMMILFVLCQVPNGIFESGFDEIFKNDYPNWKEFINVLMKHKQKKVPEIEEMNESSEESLDEETSWLITSQHVEEVNEHRYYAYQIVYSFINKSILTTDQKSTACKSVLVHLSHVCRNIMRAAKETELLMLSLTKFTAAIDVGIWSNNEDFKNPSAYYKDYENLMNEPRVYFAYLEPNFQQFLDLEYLNQVFPIKSKLSVIVW